MFPTGVNPGGHGIFDFLRRNPKNYLPELALNRYEQRKLLTPRGCKSVPGVPIWELLEPPAKARRFCAALYVPAQSRPRPDAFGHGRPRPTRGPRNLDVLYVERLSHRA